MEERGLRKSDWNTQAADCLSALEAGIPAGSFFGDISEMFETTFLEV